MADELLDWLATLPEVAGYTPKDKYSDFRKVFMGTIEGKRVLRHIMDLGMVFNQPRLDSPVDPYMQLAIVGRRYLALKILETVNNEPTEKPAKRPPTQVRRPGQE